MTAEDNPVKAGPTVPLKLLVSLPATPPLTDATMLLAAGAIWSSL